MHKIFILASLLLTISNVVAQYPGFVLKEHPETFENSLRRETESIQSIKSDFMQTKSLTMLSEAINSTGKFWFHKTDKLRMEYLRPYTYLMVLNNGKIYIKDGVKENKVSAGSNQLFQQVNRILLDCVAGTMLGNPDFQSRIFEGAASWLIEFKPIANNLKDLYKNINIVVDKKDYTALSIEMFEISGDKTIIRFQNITINEPFPRFGF